MFGKELHCSPFTVPVGRVFEVSALLSVGQSGLEKREACERRVLGQRDEVRCVRLKQVERVKVSNIIGVHNNLECKFYHRLKCGRPAQLRCSTARRIAKADQIC